VIFEVRLKAGFFKTQLYFMSIAGGQIVLTPQEHFANGRLIIAEDDLESVGITSWDMVDGELEIATSHRVYLGRFVSSTDLEAVARSLCREFGSKFRFQHGVI